MSRRGAVIAALGAGREAAIDHVAQQARDRIKEFVAGLDDTDEGWQDSTKAKHEQVVFRAFHRALSVAVEVAALMPPAPTEDDEPF